MKITEKMLLDGYDGISKDGVTAQSLICGERIWWAYRHNHAEGANVTEDRAEADYISLENDRHGEIDLDDDCAGHSAIQKLYDASQKIYGNQI